MAIKEDFKWKLSCFLIVFPFTAILHHAVFWIPTCMLNPFGYDYVPSLIINWLSRDPSLPWAIIFSSVVYYLGGFSQLIKKAVYSFLPSFLPLTLWIWDIPFTGRIICSTFHDGKLILFGDFVVRSRHFYELGIIFWILILLFLSFLGKRSKD